MQEKSNALEGRIGEVVFDNGMHFHIEYLPDNKLRWTNVQDNSTETETVQVCQLDDGIFTINWVESTGIVVNHGININAGTAHGFLTMNDADVYGGRKPMHYDGTYRLINKDGSDDTVPFTNLQIVEEFWNGFFNKHDASYGKKYLAAPYTQHNPTVADGVEAFLNTFVPLFEGKLKTQQSKIVHAASNGDLVFLHNHVTLNDEDKGRAALDIFRVENGKIVEHWDVLQNVPDTASNTHPMF